MRNKLVVLFLLIACPILIAQQALNNDGVLKLVKAGLSEDLIISTINASPAGYDTSANGLVALKSGGASDKEIAAIVLRASGTSTVSSPATALSGVSLPNGITDVGVYYRDRSGNWQPLLPEIVNFKTGGVLKNLASAGFVKGDINGHVAGKKSKYDLTFPVVLAVYVPEGTDITEYQLLRLRNNADNREFRSVTGGIMHVAGGATRDLVEYQPQRIAPRVFQISLLTGLGKGEYGLLPPGSYGSSNMGSSGKIYTVSVIE